MGLLSEVPVLLHVFIGFVTDVFNVIVLIAGGLFMFNGVITFADYSAFFLAVNLFISPVMTLILWNNPFSFFYSSRKSFDEDELPLLKSMFEGCYWAATR